jgi:hypothetical protein
MEGEVMVRTQIYLTKQEHMALKAISKLRGRPRSDLIRQAIDSFIETHGIGSRIEKMRPACGIWTDRSTEELQAIRAGLDREFHSENPA